MAQLVYQIEEYVKYGFKIVGIVGIDRSPSCGINTTSINNQEVDGKGVFIETLQKKLEKKAIKINMTGIKSAEIDEAQKRIQELLNKQ